MLTKVDDGERLARVTALAERVRDLGREIGLPYVAASEDISSPEPMLGADGKPLAETTFEWLDSSLRYWRDRAFALRAPFILAARYTAEPFFFHQGRFSSWRPLPRLETIEVAVAAESFGVQSAIIAPTYLTGGVIGAVVWASSESLAGLPAIYEKRADELHGAALRLVSAYRDGRDDDAPPVRLTKREIQCLKWAAAGKTDADIAQIIGIAGPTVRFHVQNAALKLRVAGRAQAIHRATGLGYIGGAP
ncbi:helix-turn-helix transcriptional regulator [Caulobacter segnis]|uniref:helix-turn-helix transcriptional regulator n=1 Tax=Caulobacter segnis TaxID=88688 RepID=UPI001CBD5EA6|nr:helix-turn-helix transcriptional regulator [Caulobacter segnis]UAL11071.1 helix-turn-helix transcriptional regulator [Caulobacter segnis]